MTIGSLFSGIGGLELGLERAGLGRVIWQVELDELRRGVLAKHWPTAKRYEDVRTFAVMVENGGERQVDVICGGFPCQDVSDASRGRGGGIDGARSGLWRFFARIVAALGPRRVVVENVGGAAVRKWLPTVRRDLHVLGYRTRALRIDARDVGAPFPGARIFVVAAPYAEGESALAFNAQVAWLSPAARLGRHWRESAPTALGMVDGLPRGLDRVRACGDAVVPDCAELVGRLIRSAA